MPEKNASLPPHVLYGTMPDTTLRPVAMYSIIPTKYIPDNPKIIQNIMRNISLFIANLYNLPIRCEVLIVNDNYCFHHPSYNCMSTTLDLSEVGLKQVRYKNIPHRIYYDILKKYRVGLL